MSSGFRKTSRRSSWWGTASRLFPGSVTATMNSAGDSRRSPAARRADSIRFQASAWKARVSVVLPDLVATITSVASGSSALHVSATAAGSVESRILTVSQSSISRNASARTSGARLLPPIPATTAARNPASRMPSPKPSRAGACSTKPVGLSSQPSRVAIRAWTAGSADHRLVSRSWSRSTQRSSSARRSAAVTASTRAASVIRASSASGSNSAGSVSAISDLLRP